MNPPNASSHFPHVNLLGMDLCVLSGAKIVLDYGQKSATLQFPPPMEVISSIYGICVNLSPAPYADRDQTEGSTKIWHILYGELGI